MKSYGIVGGLFAVGIALVACQTQEAAVGNTLAAVCGEGQAIQTAASSQQGLAAAAQAGIKVGTVVGKVSVLNTQLQGYCTLAQLALPIVAGGINEVQTASAGVLGTHAAPPALVAAAKSGALK